jgi:hypothetical protein
MNVIVEQEKDDVAIDTIATYGLSSCYFFLLDGNYCDDNITIPFAYLNHHSKWIEPDTDPPIDIVVSFLNIFTRFLKHYLPKILPTQNKFVFTKLNNMQLVIGGSRKVVIDSIKDSFSLMIRSDQLIYDKIKSLRNEKKCTHPRR